MSHLRLLPHAGNQADSSAAQNCIKCTKIEIYTRQHQSWLNTSLGAKSLLLQEGGTPFTSPSTAGFVANRIISF